MRDSNYRSITNNRAAVTITTSLYDRRALDVTADKPLVNSLNHLTYLVSLSAKVRETLANDGGIERLVEILHECHNTTFNAQDNIFNSEKKLLTAWKWTLAFQCLVLIGTGGTEKIRLKVVAAGMLPIIATVLDNYMSLHEGTLVPGTAPVCPFMHGGSNSQGGIFNSYDDRRGDAAAAAAAAAANNANLHGNGNGASPAAAAAAAFSLAPPATANFVNHGAAPAGVAAAAANSMPLFAHSDPQAPVAAENATTAANALRNMELGHDNPMLGSMDSAAQGHRYNVQADSKHQVIMPFLNNLYINSLTSEDYDNLTVDQLLRLVRCSINSLPNQKYDTLFAGPPRGAVNNDIRRRFLIITILRKLREEKEQECPDPAYREPHEYEMDTNLRFLSDLYLQDERSTHITNMIHAKSAPRNFTETGVVIPRDDDVVWCLQLLAYISKYPYLKEVLQNTHLVIDMSIREKKPKCFAGSRMKANYQGKTNNKSAPASARQGLLARKGGIFTSHPNETNGETFIERFNASPSNSPQMLSDLNLRNDDFDLNDDMLNLYSKRDDGGLTEDAEANDLDDNDDSEEDSDHRVKDEDGDVNEYLLNFDDNVTMTDRSLSDLSKLYDGIIDAESIVNDVDREIALHYVSEKINRYIDKEYQQLSDTIIAKRAEETEYLTEKWNYETYSHFDIDDDGDNTHGDYDESLMDHKKVNLFPMVEKFTFLAGTDMYYWSGVIMRNSCRRNDLRGGVRQCGNLECGKWESYPREFSKCKKYKRTKYCSRECQMRAWHCHKNWCVPSASSATNSTHTTASRANTTERRGQEENVSSAHNHHHHHHHQNHDDDESSSVAGRSPVNVTTISGPAETDGLTLNTPDATHNTPLE